MEQTTLKQIFDEIVNTHGIKHWIFAARKNKEFMEAVYELTKEYSDIPDGPRIHAAVHNENITCKNGNRRRYINLTKGWGYCGIGKKCQCLMDKAATFSKEMHEIASDDWKKSRIEKAIQTNMDRYGVDNVGKLEKSKQAHKDFYNDPIKVKESMNKLKSTMLKKYGVEYPHQSEIIRKICKENILEKYGSQHFYHLTEIKEKRIKTNMDKYGGKTPFSSKLIMDKIKQSRIANLVQKVNHIVNSWGLTLEEPYKGTSIKHKFSCNTCKTVFDAIYPGGAKPITNSYTESRIVKCYNCTPRVYTSKAELEILSYIKSICSDAYGSDKSIINPFEVDIVIPSKMVAIEYCGLYWHSEKQGKDKNYHVSKLNKLNEKGYKLITIFEDEWVFKKDIVLSRLNHLLGVNESGIFARKTIIQHISSDIASMFLNQYHIQGSAWANYYYGAYYNDVLIGVMTFSRPRINMGRRTGAMELLRFATNGLNHPGLASKLFNYFIKEHNPDEIISYADRRWSDGNLYIKIGFELDSATEPNYFYMDNYTARHQRFKYRKDVLVKQGFEIDKSERQIMFERGFDRIYDCGSLKFIWRNR